MIALVLATLASAQDATYAFPTIDEHYGFFYPTAYFDEGGVTDWNCGAITYGGHNGSDFGGGGFDGMDAGRAIVAASPGTVVYVNDGEYDRCISGDCPGGGGFGNYVKVEHDGGWSTYYAHLKMWSIPVSIGDRVDCGDSLGEMGSSGFSTGPHLHFEVRDAAGTQYDPFEGPCSSNPTSFWIEQGVYDGLPGNTCDGGGDPDPEPGDLVVDVDPLVVGMVATVTVTGALPGEEVTVVRAGARGGWCPPILGGACTDLSRSARLWDSGRADGDGVAAFPRLVALDSMRGHAHYIQAFAYRDGAWVRSEVVERFIE